MRARRAPLAALILVAGCATAAVEDYGSGGGRDGGRRGDAGGAGPGDLATGQCPGKDLQNDPMNCGQCGRVCQLPHVATSACKAGQCVVIACEAGWFHLDDKAPSCECQHLPAAPQPFHQCPAALEGGTVSAGMSSMLTLAGTLVPEGDEAWYRVISSDVPHPDNSCSKYHLKVSFADNPGGQFRFDVVFDDCVNRASCGQGESPIGLTEYEFDANNGPMGGGECPCVNGTTTPATHKCGSHSQILRLRIYRVAATPVTCEPYKVVVTNGT